MAKKLDPNKIRSVILEAIHSTPDIRDMVAGSDNQIADQLTDQIVKGTITGDRINPTINDLAARYRGQVNNGNLGRLIANVSGALGNNPFVEDRFMTEDATPVATAAPVSPAQSSMDPFLQKKFDDLFGTTQEAGLKRIGESFKDAKSVLSEKDAALGRYRSPIAKYGEEPLAAQEELAKSDLIGSLSGQKASGILDYNKYYDTLLAGERRASEQKSQFQQQFGYQKESDAANRDLAKKLGELQAGAQNQPRSWLDYFNVFAGPASAIGSAFILGNSNESLCALRAIQSLVRLDGKDGRLSEIIKVVEDNGFEEIEDGYLTPEQIVKVLFDLGYEVSMNVGRLPETIAGPVLCVVNCSEYYGIEGDISAHAVVRTPEGKTIDAYKRALPKEYSGADKYLANAEKFDWSKWEGLYFMVEG